MKSASVWANWLIAAAMKRELERPPTPEFRVPIVVEAKRGPRFGDLTEFPPPQEPGQPAGHAGPTAGY